MTGVQTCALPICRLSACDAAFFPQPASSSAAASNHTKHFFTVNPPFPEGFPLSQHLSVCHAARLGPLCASQSSRLAGRESSPIHFSRRRPPRGLPLGVYVAKNTLRGESAFSRIFCVKTHGSERNLFCQKRQRPFLTSSYYPRTQAFRALPSGSSTRRPAVTLTSGAAARISATDVSMPLLPLVQKGRMVFPVRS